MFDDRGPVVAGVRGDEDLVAGAAAPDAEFTVDGEVLGVALDGDDVDRFGLVGVDVDAEAEVSG